MKSEIDPRRRSVFTNYTSRKYPRPSGAEQATDAPQGRSPRTGSSIVNRQSSIDLALARSFLYRFLAKAYEYPDPDGRAWLGQADVQSAFQSAINVFAGATGLSSDQADDRSHRELRNRKSQIANRKSDSSPGKISPQSDENALAASASEFVRCLTNDRFESFAAEYVAAFSHAARGSCPLNEIEYGDLKADPLFQPHRLADLTAFYQAFGLEIAGDAGERQDHICLELEFMSVLAAKEAFALEHQLAGEEFAVCRRTQKDFLREHLGRWTPAFARRLTQAVGQGALGALAEFTLQLVVADCRALGVTAGSEELLLRPVDEAGEGLCSSCGIKNLPPGATTAT